MSGANEVKKHPVAPALKDFLESDLGRQLIAGKAEGIYLKNRIESAFLKGWTACREQMMRET